MEREKFLPIGTVVLLKGADKKIMVTGFLPIKHNEEEAVAYDYSGCVYPEGILSFDEVLLFNHDQIDEIYYLGYEDEEEKEFKKTFKEELDKIIEEDEDIDVEENNEEVETTEEEPETLESPNNIFDKLREE